MVFQAIWRGANRQLQEHRRFAISLGKADFWIEQDGKAGELLLHVEPLASGAYIDPRKYAALGVLALWDPPEIDGTSTTLRLTPIPLEWLNASSRVLDFLRRLGLTVRLDNRTLEVSNQTLSPTALLKRTGIALFALDTFTQEHVSSEQFATVRRVAMRTFQRDCEELLTLLNETTGKEALRRFLAPPSRHPEHAGRDEAIASTLVDIGTRRLVHFDCGGGSLLRRLLRKIQLREAVGIESSPTRAARAAARSDNPIEVLRGSLTEPPDDVSANATALVVESLPLPSDTRLIGVADTLFRSIGFESVLCLEGTSSKWTPLQFETWARSVQEQFRYLAAPWSCDEDFGVLFRRTDDSLPRGVPKKIGGFEITTRLGRSVRIEPEQWSKTDEAFSRRTVDPRWLIYLPPGMCSRQTDQIDGSLEHPNAAFDYYRSEGISSVVVQTKHMGSRAIVVVCRDESAALRRFGSSSLGCVCTRNGRPFWNDPTSALNAIRDGLSRADFWKRFNTDWVCLDGEMLPWALKSENLIDDTHGEILLCGESIIAQMKRALDRFAPEEVSLLAEREECFRKYRILHERYQVGIGEPFQFAPFHLIATEGRSYFNRTHLWQMEALSSLVKRAGGPFLRTSYRHLSLTDQTAVESCGKWWTELSKAGEEGLVVKPLYFVPRGRRGLAQPALKCRGQEHLRLVYGPEYDLLENRWSLLQREALTRRREKHRRVLKQLVLSVEGVERFVRGERLERVEVCNRAILALEN